MSFAATRSETFKSIPRALKEKRWGDWFKTEKIGLEKARGKKRRSACLVSSSIPENTAVGAEMRKKRSKRGPLRTRSTGASSAARNSPTRRHLVAIRMPTRRSG